MKTGPEEQAGAKNEIMVSFHEIVRMLLVRAIKIAFREHRADEGVEGLGRIGVRGVGAAALLEICTRTRYVAAQVIEADTQRRAQVVDEATNVAAKGAARRGDGAVDAGLIQATLFGSIEEIRDVLIESGRIPRSQAVGVRLAGSRNDRGKVRITDTCPRNDVADVSVDVLGRIRRRLGDALVATTWGERDGYGKGHDL